MGKEIEELKPWDLDCRQKDVSPSMHESLPLDMVMGLQKQTLPRWTTT